MVRSKYGRYIHRKLIGKSAHPEITAPTASFRLKKGISEIDISLDWCCISQPFLIENRPVMDDFDRFLVFSGGDPLNLDDFKAEVEISLGEKGEKYHFNEPRVIYIPRGLVHYPLNIKKVEKPIMMLDITSKLEYAGKEITDYAKYITAPSIKTHIMMTKNYRDDKLLREQKWSMKELTYSGKDAAGGGLTLYWFPVTEPHIMYEPPHSHDHDMLGLILGGDPMNVGEFEAELDMWLGEEGEKHTINSVSVVHHAKGLIHRQVDFQRVDKPFQELHIFMSPEYLKARTLETTPISQLQLSKS